MQLAAVALVLGAPATAGAAPTGDDAVNDNILQMEANGPVSPEGILGRINTSNDVDWYLLRLRPQQAIRFTIDVIGGTCPNGEGVRYDLSYPTGETTPSGSGSAYASGSETWTWTTPGVVGGPTQSYRFIFSGRYSSSVGCQYRMRVTSVDGGPSNAVDTTPPPAVPTAAIAEPNDFPTQAQGYLNPDAFYTGAIETSVDVDWMYAYLVPGQNATLELTATAGDASVSVLPDADSSSIASVSADPGETQTTSFTVPADGPSKNYLKVTGDEGAQWRVRLTPASAVSGPPAPPVTKPPAVVAPATPKGFIETRRVKKGQKIRASFTRVTGKVQFRFYQKVRGKSRIRRRVGVTVRKGIARAGTGSLRRGTYTVSIWQGNTRLARRTVKIVR